MKSEERERKGVKGGVKAVWKKKKLGDWMILTV